MIKPQTTLAPLTEEERLKILAEIAELDRQKALASGLPFLYGWKWYGWAREFYESKNKITLLTAGNQLSKSSTQIRKCINWATNRDLWPQLWPGETPNLFWYLYPSQEVTNIEFRVKWSEFLPRNGYENSLEYGWEEIKKGKDTIGIKFNSGVYVMFKSYGQNVHNLQTSTVYAVFADEELDVEYFDELRIRTQAVDGYFNMVFTATKGQDFWRRCMEPSEGEAEALPQAKKITASLYDSMFYEDGTPSKWTLERIKNAEAMCSTHQEVLKRIYGRFVMATGRTFSSFDAKRHFRKATKIPDDWIIFAGVDIGSGGKRDVSEVSRSQKGTHPASISFVAVSPDYKRGRVVYTWRGDDIITTAGDVFKKYTEICRDKKLYPVRKFYDYASKDFDIISGYTFERAEKSHEIGENILNTLFKHDRLLLDDDSIYEDNETWKLRNELSTLRKEANKTTAIDDACDGLRYSVSKVPWDFSDLDASTVGVTVDQEENHVISDEEHKMARSMGYRERGEDGYSNPPTFEDEIAAEFEEWNEHYGN